VIYARFGERSLKHLSWDNISDEVMDVQFGSPPLLTTEAFQAFLPAWLLRSLAGLDLEQHKVRECTLGQLAKRFLVR
jgi:hypothetical protein